MTDPDELGGSAADRRFREALREGLAAAERESQGQDDGHGQGEGQGRSRGVGSDAASPAPAQPPRARSEVFMDWAPLAVAVLAIVAVVGIALYGIAGGDLGPW